MNTFKLGLALLLFPIYSFFLFSIFHSERDDKYLLDFDASGCQTFVEIPILLNDLCAFDFDLLQTALDLDVQEINGDSYFTPIDFIPDVENANPFFSWQNDTLTFEGVFPEGLHALEINLSDTCGARYRDLFRFQISDTTTFTPICKPGIAVNLEAVSPPIDLDNDGNPEVAMARLYSDQLLIEHDFDCQSQGIPISTIFNENEDIGEPGLSILQEDGKSQLLFTCDFFYRGYHNPFELGIIATNQQGVEGNCKSLIYVLDRGVDGPLCAQVELPSITVEVETIEGRGIPAAEIGIQGSINQTFVTNYYGFLQIGTRPWLVGDMEVSVRRNDEPNTGVSVTDISILRRHLLGITSLPTPWHQLAADVNNDQLLSLMDVIEMQRVILGVQDQFSNNSSWRFFDDSIRFENPSDPWAGQTFPDSWTVHANSDFIRLRFIGVKIGDLNMNALDQ